MLKAQKISFRYKNNIPVFDDLDFLVENGEMASIIGPNGAGKSTLLKCINGINKIKSGQIFIDDKPTSAFSHKELSKKISYVPQDTSSSFAISVADAVMLGRTPYIRFKASVKDKKLVFEMIERLGLEKYAFVRLNELSGGERQRVFIARALVQNPQIMLLDEPISNLDIRYQIETLELIKSIVKSRNIIAIMILHDLSFAYRYSDAIIMLKKGAKSIEGKKNILNENSIRQIYQVNAEIYHDASYPYINPKDVIKEV